MNDLVYETLQKHPRHISSDLVLARKEDGGRYCDISDSFNRLLQECKLPRIRIHDLRHSFASNLVIAGVPLNVVMELMGHKDVSTTMIYAHLAPNAKQAAVEMLMQRSPSDEVGEGKKREGVVGG